MCDFRSALSERAPRLWGASRLVAFAGSALLASIGALTAPSTAIAANADVTVTVTPVPASVSVKRTGLDTYAAYTVTIQNNTGNVINQVTFGGSTSVSDDSVDPAPQAAFVESIPSSACPVAATPATNTVQCPVGQLRGTGTPGSVASFVVIFKAPSAGSAVNFDWQSTFSSGNSANTPPANYQTFSGTAQTALITTTDSTITSSFLSYVPSFGGTFFTGFNAVPSGADPGTTKVQVPTTPANGTAQVVEAFSGDVCAGGFACNTSQLTIPGVFSNLVVTLRRDAAYIKNGLKIQDAKVYYTGDDEPVTTLPHELALCAVVNGVPQPPAGATDLPCIAFRTAYPNKYPANPDLQGDFEWVIYTRHNGKFAT